MDILVIDPVVRLMLCDDNKELPSPFNEFNLYHLPYNGLNKARGWECHRSYTLCATGLQVAGYWVHTRAYTEAVALLSTT